MTKKIILTEEQINLIKELNKTKSRKETATDLNLSIHQINKIFNPPLTKQSYIEKYGEEAWILKQYKKKFYDKHYRQENKEHRNKTNKLYWDNHREEKREYTRNYENSRKQKDPQFRLSKILRSRINQVLKNQKTTKDLHLLELLGCSLEECKQFISSKFTNNMSWENHGTIWHIDHIIPCNYFNLSNIEEQKICFNYRNLQPLLIKDNLSKSDNLPDNFEELLLEIKSFL